VVSVIKLVIAEPQLLGSMNDLSQTLSTHHQTPTNCARVIDSLRKAVAPNGTEKQGWTVLRGIVNADEKYLQFISSNSTKPRHGDRSGISENVITEIQTRTWRIMDRF